MKSICLVIPYFGKWPKWFNIYLETCRYNPTVNWLFFTDCDIPERTSQNIKFFKMDLNDFNALASKKLGLTVILKGKRVYRSGHKIVDFKPAYGVIFEDYLKTYDFWGYSEVDIAYGDIRKFITDDMLETYDVITAKKEYVVGHFAIFKNIEKINRLYQMARGYRRVFMYANSWYNFEECGKDWEYLLLGGDIFAKRPIRERILYFIMRCINRTCELLGGKNPFWVIHEVESITECVKRLEKEGYLKSFFESIGKEPGVEFKSGDTWKLYWDKGKLVELYKNDEIMYFHFLWLKFTLRFIIPAWHKIPEKFFITEAGFSEE